jgi:hypothetical protein
MHRRVRVQEAREELRTPRAAGVAGLVFSVLFMVSLLLTVPLGGRFGSAMPTWYTSGDSSIIVFIGSYATPFAGIAFLWFIGVVRDRIGRRDDRLFSTVFLGSGVLFIAMLFAASATASAMALRIKAFGASTPADPAVVQWAQALTSAFLFVYAARAAGVFMIVTSTIAWRTRSVPRWVAVTGYVVAALLLLSLHYFELVIMLFPMWVALLSVFILLTPEQGDLDDEAAEDVAPEVAR